MCIYFLDGAWLFVINDRLVEVSQDLHRQWRSKSARLVHKSQACACNIHCFGLDLSRLFLVGALLARAAQFQALRISATALASTRFSKTVNFQVGDSSGHGS